MVILAGVLLTACGTENGIEVHRVWMSPAARGENSVVYFVMHNHASEPDELSSVTSDAAQNVELEQSANSGETMKKIGISASRKSIICLKKRRISSHGSLQWKYSRIMGLG